MRASGGTNVGLALSVVERTKATMACFDAPSFQDGSGSVWATATVLAARPAISSVRSARRVMVPAFMLRLLPLGRR